MLKTINILNKRARFDFELIEKYSAGIVLTGTEIKSIRLGKANITESFCEFNERGELFVINMYIEEYAFGNQFNHKARSERKLLLNKRSGTIVNPLLSESLNNFFNSFLFKRSLRSLFVLWL